MYIYTFILISFKTLFLKSLIFKFSQSGPDTLEIHGWGVSKEKFSFLRNTHLCLPVSCWNHLNSRTKRAYQHVSLKKSNFSFNCDSSDKTRVFFFFFLRPGIWREHLQNKTGETKPAQHWNQRGPQMCQQVPCCLVKKSQFPDKLSRDVFKWFTMYKDLSQKLFHGSLWKWEHAEAFICADAGVQLQRCAL